MFRISEHRAIDEIIIKKGLAAAYTSISSIFASISISYLF